jgi:hypothetical protein
MIERIFRRLNSLKPTVLGRWCLSDKTQANLKIDMANIDHCGTCSYERPSIISKVNPTEAIVPNLKNTELMIIEHKKNI